MLLALQTCHNRPEGKILHRDLKPDNIVISLRPLSAKLIDFERAQPRTLTTVGHVRGTPGYFPERENLKDGSTKWDSYALAAIALECDMEKDAYLHVMTERGPKAKLNEYLNEKGTCPELRNLLRRTLLAHDADDILEINDNNFGIFFDKLCNLFAELCRLCGI